MKEHGDPAEVQGWLFYDGQGRNGFRALSPFPSRPGEGLQHLGEGVRLVLRVAQEEACEQGMASLGGFQGEVVFDPGPEGEQGFVKVPGGGSGAEYFVSVHRPNIRFFRFPSNPHL